MKKIIPFFLLLFNTFCFSQVDTTQRPYQIKYCKITYTFFNGPQKGTKVVIFDDWGKYEKMYGVTENDTVFMKDFFNRDTTLKKLGVNINSALAKQSELIINTPEYIYNINPDTKIGVKRQRSKTAWINAIYAPDKKIIGDELYLGKKCQLVILEDFMKLWYWNGICLKKELLKTKTDKMREYAIEIDEKYIPTKSEFEVPKDVKMENSQY